jgi:hypothetical protein
MNLNAVAPPPSRLQLALHFGTDKLPNCAIYERYLAALRDRHITLLEIGIGGSQDPLAGGASLRMWRQYFPNGAIHGLDLYDKSSHEQDRISSHRASQDDPAALRRISAQIGTIDIIVDDGSHISQHVIISFETLFPVLAAGGLYIVEDIGTSYWPEYGGSTDLATTDTSVAHFKRYVDGIQHQHFHHTYTPSYAEQHLAFIHFYPNIIIMQKR